MMESLIRIFHYDAEGLEKSYNNDNWLVGIKNYKPANNVLLMDSVERHLQTDELFIPLTGGNRVVTMEADDLRMQIQVMQVGCIYCIPKGVWHNVVMPEYGKIILIEQSDTCMDNSEVLMLSEMQKTDLYQLMG